MTTHMKSLPTEFESHSNFFEEIVGRREVAGLSHEQLRNSFSEERILVIGAGGTIGSAISRKLVLAGLSETYFLDRDESALHHLALSLSNEAASHSEKCIVADIKDFESVYSAIIQIQPTMILHAAALKHLVVLERFPREGFVTNVIGTLNVLEASSRSGVKNFINISTDKAALPTSVLGMTKKITEVLVEDFSREQFELAASVRFGNVFASRGSVIETFVHQLKNNLPITITDEKVARFFMSHNEAANLVLSAATIKENGTFVQKMGEEVKITEIVKQLAKWLDVEYELVFVGLHSGEKLSEDLYDGDILQTKFSDIVKIKDSTNARIREEVNQMRTEIPSDIGGKLRELISIIYKSASVQSHD